MVSDPEAYGTGICSCVSMPVPDKLSDLIRASVLGCIRIKQFLFRSISISLDAKIFDCFYFISKYDLDPYPHESGTFDWIWIRNRENSKLESGSGINHFGSTTLLKTMEPFPGFCCIMVVRADCRLHKFVSDALRAQSNEKRVLT